MTWDLLTAILKEHGIYAFSVAVLGWAYWQERKENRAAVRADKADNRQMITALVEVKDALQSFKEFLETRLPKR